MTEIDYLKLISFILTLQLKHTKKIRQDGKILTDKEILEYQVLQDKSYNKGVIE